MGHIPPAGHQLQGLFPAEENSTSDSSKCSASPPPPLSPWHSVLFRDTNANTYYCPRLIRQDITKIGLLTHQLQHTLPPTWAPVYQAALAAPFEAPTGTPPRETLLAF